MDAFTILTLLNAAAEAIRHGISLAQFFRDYLKPDEQVALETRLPVLQQLGCQTEREIRRLVANWKPPVPIREDQRDELTNALLNLSRGVRAQTTRGASGSDRTTMSGLIDQLLGSLLTVRRRGEPVSPNYRDWHLERFLGKGSFGEVWLGRNKGYPEPRAFKFFTQPDARDWLLAREGQTLYQVRKQLRGQPNFIDFLDVVTQGTEYPFLVLEYVPGGSLEEWILEKPTHRSPLQKQEVTEGIIRGLSRAHAERLFHGDLKPANVLLTEAPDVQPKIADFGLGVVRSTDSGSVAPAGADGLFGTTMYLPPEAMETFAPRDPAKFDVFALGVLWYQLLVERIERPPYDVAEQLQLAGADSHTIRTIIRCLAHPKRRFEDACEVETAHLELPAEPWEVPAGCFNVGPLVREYLAGLPR